MKTLTITKDDVLTAIETEPVLRAGWFISPFDGDDSVCVIGATVRRQCPGLTKYSLNELCFSVAEENVASWHTAKSSNCLSALSIVWEFMNKYNDASPEDLRWNIWEWVEENIPDEWEYELVVNGGVA